MWLEYWLIKLIEIVRAVVGEIFGHKSEGDEMQKDTFKIHK